MSEKFITTEQFENSMQGINNVLVSLSETLKVNANEAIAKEEKLSAIKQLQIARDKEIALAKKAHNIKLEKLQKAWESEKKSILAKFNPELEALRNESKEKFYTASEGIGETVGKVVEGPLSVTRSIFGGIKKGAMRQ